MSDLHQRKLRSVPPGSRDQITPTPHCSVVNVEPVFCTADLAVCQYSLPVAPTSRLWECTSGSPYDRAGGAPGSCLSMAAHLRPPLLARHDAESIPPHRTGITDSPYLHIYTFHSSQRLHIPSTVRPHSATLLIFAAVRTRSAGDAQRCHCRNRLESLT